MAHPTNTCTKQTQPVLPVQPVQPTNPTNSTNSTNPTKPTRASNQTQFTLSLPFKDVSNHPSSYPSSTLSFPKSVHTCTPNPLSLLTQAIQQTYKSKNEWERCREKRRLEYLNKMIPSLDNEYHGIMDVESFTTCHFGQTHEPLPQDPSRCVVDCTSDFLIW